MNLKSWRIAAALALAEGLDWGRWAKGLTAPIAESPEDYCPTCGGRCDECGGWGGITDPLSDQAYPCPHACRSPRERSQVVVDDPSDVEAYKADCACRNVEPGPLPALHHNGAVSWEVGTRRTDPRLIAVVCAGEVVFDVLIEGTVRWNSESRHATIDDLARATELARVVVEVLRG